MGRDARLNPRSLDGGKSERQTLEARVDRFVEFFHTREEFLGYLEGRDISQTERDYLESCLPLRLRVAPDRYDVKYIVGKPVNPDQEIIVMTDDATA